VSLDASDLRARLRAVARAGPDAVVLGFEGQALGEAARALRDAGYGGLLLATDDDRAALLRGGGALDGALLLADAFVPLPDSRGARFARAYEARYGRPPSRFAASAYEVGTLLAEAGERLLREGRAVAGSRLRDVLVAGRRFPSLYAGDLVVRDDGGLARPLALFRAEGDRLVFETYVDLDGRALGAARRSDP
jgi:ABC-type branched-subunit amino acid transport system substrate-binding protein